LAASRDSTTTRRDRDGIWDRQRKGITKTRRLLWERRAEIFNVDIYSESRSTRQWALMGFLNYFGIFPISASMGYYWALMGLCKKTQLTVKRPAKRPTIFTSSAAAS
jgi:hypothetical protein